MIITTITISTIVPIPIYMRFPLLVTPAQLPFRSSVKPVMSARALHYLVRYCSASAVRRVRPSPGASGSGLTTPPDGSRAPSKNVDSMRT